MASTKLYLDLRSHAKDGKGNLIIIITHNRTTSSIPTGIRLFPDEWDGNMIKQNSPNAALNIVIIDKKASIDKSIALLSLESNIDTVTATELKSHIIEGIPRKNGGHLIADVFNDYMSQSMKDGTREVYKAALRKVIAFGGEGLRIERLNLKWLRDFEQYLSLTQGPNGRAIYFRCLRSICNYARHTGIMSSYPFENFKFKTEPTRKRSIHIDLFRKFISYETSETNNRYRDYFILSFLLIGINIKDLLTARHSQVVNGRLEYIRNKTHKKYSIKIEPEASVLLNKYAGRDYLLEAMDHCTHHKSFARAINEACQMIGPKVEVRDELFPDKTVMKVEPIIPGITTYFARHSWATFAYEIGISIDIISQALGHSMNNRTTMIYIRYDQSKVDEANRKVIDYVLSPQRLSLSAKSN